MSLGSSSLGSVSLGGSRVVGQIVDLALSTTGTTTVSFGLSVGKALALAATGQTVASFGLSVGKPLGMNVLCGTLFTARLSTIHAKKPKPTLILSPEPFPFDTLTESFDLQFDSQLVGTGNLAFDSEGEVGDVDFDKQLVGSGGILFDVDAKPKGIVFDL